MVTAVTSGNVTITVTYQGRTATTGVAISIATTTGNSMTASIDGVAFSAVTASVAHGTGIISIGGVNGFTGQYLALVVAMPEVVGSYSIGSGSSANASLTIPAASSGWNASPTTGSGTIALTTLTANSATGTFSLNLQPVPGTTATSTKVVTNGVFNVRF
jgi:hypothetical protein